MKKILYVILLITLIFLINNKYKSYLTATDNELVNISKSDEAEIKNISKEFIKLFLNNPNDRKLNEFCVSNDFWGAPGGETLKIYVVEKFDIEKLDAKKDKELGVFVRMLIKFHVSAVIDADSFKKVNKENKEIIGFVKEDKIWKLKMDFNPFYYTKEGALLWASVNNDTDNIIYKKVSNLIIQHLK